ncbi:hypothetical protein BJI47_12445 [Rhodococcus sp. 1168]|nr:hypothetical protein BJI47_12445 [Rhodococcus sp. 1168]
MLTPHSLDGAVTDAEMIGEQSRTPMFDTALLRRRCRCHRNQLVTIEHAGPAGAVFVEQSVHAGVLVAGPPVDHGLPRDREPARDLRMRTPPAASHTILTRCTGPAFVVHISSWSRSVPGDLQRGSAHK